MKNPIIDIPNSYFRHQAQTGDIRYQIRYLWMRIGHPIIITLVWLGLVLFLYRYLLNSHDFTNNLHRLGDYGLVIAFMSAFVGVWFILRYLLRTLIRLWRTKEIEPNITRPPPLDSRIITVMHDDKGNIQKIYRH